MRPPLFASALMLLSWVLPAAGSAASLEGRIWLPAASAWSSPDDLARRLASADIVLLGERHDNPEHHRLEAWALHRLGEAGRHPTVAFEMISPEQREALDRYRADHPGDMQGLGEAVDWAHSGWPDWSWYEPVFAEAAAWPIRPANLSRPVLRAVLKGEADAETRAALDLNHPWPEPVTQALAEEIRQAHCGQMPERAIPGMVAVQRARDAVMAHAVADDTPDGAVLVAGEGHVRGDWGVPRHLADLAPGRRVFTLGFIEVEDGETDPAAYAQAFGGGLPFDAVWFTARAERGDPCASLRPRNK